jgi:hypothetical protein
MERFVTCLQCRKGLDSLQATEQLIRRRAIGRQNEDVNLGGRLLPLDATIEVRAARNHEGEE